jgi:hypothetical protein
VIDARGWVLEASPLFEEAVLVAEVPVLLDAKPTFYARWGDCFAGLCILATASSFARSLRRAGGDGATVALENPGPGRGSEAGRGDRAEAMRGESRG